MGPKEFFSMKGSQTGMCRNVLWDPQLCAVEHWLACSGSNGLCYFSPSFEKKIEQLAVPSVCHLALWWPYSKQCSCLNKKGLAPQFYISERKGVFFISWSLLMCTYTYKNIYLSALWEEFVCSKMTAFFPSSQRCINLY